jgi:hypothetical protein
MRGRGAAPAGSSGRQKATRGIPREEREAQIPASLAERSREEEDEGEEEDEDEDEDEGDEEACKSITGYMHILLV